MAIPNVGKCFATVEPFLGYLESVTFNLWRPRFITMHHTGAPDLKTWLGWQKRNVPVTDEQWLRNLAAYYASLGWSAGPHFFFTPTHFCVLSPPNRRGVHAVSFNSMSWGVECVGDFDREEFSGDIRSKYIQGLACLHVAAGLQPAPFERGVRGLHFHRDDPKTSKTCPGVKVQKPFVVAQIDRVMGEMTGGDHPDEKIEVAEPTGNLTRYVTVAAPDGLNMRTAASGKAPVIENLKPTTKLQVYSEAMNGETKWLKVSVAGENDMGWVSAKFVTPVT